MLKVEEKDPINSEEVQEQSFEELGNKHEEITFQTRELEQKLKVARKAALDVAIAYNRAHPIFKRVSDDVWLQILSFVPMRARAQAQQASRGFYRLMTNPRLSNFPLDYTAVLKSTSLGERLMPGSHRDGVFNLSKNRFCIVQEVKVFPRKTMDVSEQPDALNSFNVTLFNSDTCAIVQRFRIDLPFKFISLVAAIDDKKLLFLQKQNSCGVRFTVYDLSTKKAGILYEQQDHFTGGFWQLTTGQFAIVFKPGDIFDVNNKLILRLLTLKTASEAEKIDITLDFELLDYINIYEIKSGDFKNYLLLYDNKKFRVINLQGQLLTTIPYELDSYCSIYGTEIQEPKPNELLFNCSSCLLHVNLVTGVSKVIEAKELLGKYCFRKFLDVENILLVNHSNDPGNQLLVANLRTKTASVIATFEADEFYDDTETLKNGNLVVRIKNKETDDYRYEFYCFADKQFIPKPISQIEEMASSPSISSTSPIPGN